MVNVRDSINIVWKASNDLRGVLDAGAQKNVIAPLITLKAIEFTPGMYEISPQAKWSHIIFQGFSLKDNMLKAFYDVEHRNPSLKGVFINSDLENLDEEIFQRLVPLINQVETTPEILEEVFYRFASEEGKRGEFITPRSIAELIPNLLDIKGGDIYDGTAGVGQLLVESGKYARQLEKDVHIWGQEINKTTWALGKMNLILAGFNHNYALGDTLSEPAFTAEGYLRKFDYVVMNFPFSLKGWGREKAEYDLYRRFPYGIPSEANADMAFVQHAFSSLKEEGKAAVIVTHGTLFRSGADRKIREAMIEDDVIEAVIGLPPNLFFTTSIPAAILILNKNKSADRKGKIQFINAEHTFEKIRGQNILREEDIDKISIAYHKQQSIKQFSTTVSIEDIEDANLHFGPYFEVDEVESMFGIIQVNRKVYEKSNAPKAELRNMVEMFRGMNVPSKKEFEKEEGEYYLIQLADVQDGKIIFHQLTTINLDSKKARTYEVQEGDIILSSRGSAIKIAVVPKLDKKLILSHNFIGMRPKRGVNQYFIKSFLESPIGTYYISSKQKGTAVSVLSIKDIESIPVPDMEINTQNEIGRAFIRANEELNNTIQQAREKQNRDYYKLYEEMGITSAFNKYNNDN